MIVRNWGGSRSSALSVRFADREQLDLVVNGPAAIGIETGDSRRAADL